MRNLVVLGVVATLTGALAAVAQQAVQPIAPPPVGGEYYDGGYGGYGGGRASTAAEGAMRGMGDVIRSQGQANLDNSAAAINYSVARRSEIDNYRAGTSAYFEMRAYNRQARAAERGPHTTMEQAIRFAQFGKPKPLSASDLDVVTGAVQWPLALQADVFAKNRTELEKLFASRASKSSVSLDEYTKIQSVTKTMISDLKKQVRQFTPSKYIESLRFLQSLAYEAS